MLSKYCGDRDIITPISKNCEIIRERYGGRPAQNYSRFTNHTAARFAQLMIGYKTWSDYFTFCIVRNPFDRLISQYWFSTRDPRPCIDDYIYNLPRVYVTNWPLYADRFDDVIVDHICRYENLQNDLEKISGKIGLTESEIILPKAKSGFRKDRRHYSEVLSSKTIQHIKRVCTKEIEYFEYL
jgi:hypothetical protein